jgi:UTP-glucose-1-phosphate uridylyltransferase
VKLIGEDYDTGEKIGFVKATVAFAMKNERFSVELTEFFKSLKEN